MPTKLKKLVEARMAKTGENWQTAKRHVRAQIAPPMTAPPTSTEAKVGTVQQTVAESVAALPIKPAYSGPVYTLKYLYEGARKLFERRPETRIFTASVAGLKATVSDEIGPNGAVAMMDTVDVTFVEDTPGNWCFDGQIAFLPGDLDGGRQSVHFDLLGTSEGRERLGDLIVEEIRAAEPWLAERVSHLRVVSGDMRRDNLVVVVSLGLLDEQEQHFAQLVAALYEADSLASTEMSKGALNLDTDTAPKRNAIAAARNALALVQDAAQTSRQKDVAVRALDRDRTWRLWEESLDRIDGSADDSIGSSRHIAAMGGMDMSDESSALEQMNRDVGDITDEASAIEQMNQQFRSMTGEDSALEQMKRHVGDITGEDSALEQMKRHVGDITDEASAIEQIRDITGGNGALVQIGRKMRDITGAVSATEQLVRRGRDMRGEGSAVAQLKRQASGIADLGGAVAQLKRQVSGVADLGGAVAQLKRSQEQTGLLGIEGGDGDEPEPEHEE